MSHETQDRSVYLRSQLLHNLKNLTWFVSLDWVFCNISVLIWHFWEKKNFNIFLPKTHYVTRNSRQKCLFVVSITSQWTKMFNLTCWFKTNFCYISALIWQVWKKTIFCRFFLVFLPRTFFTILFHLSKID